MDRIRAGLDNKKFEPCELLPLITLWITEKGSAAQFIDWVNGLSQEKEEIFRALNASSIGEAEEVETGIELGLRPTTDVPIHHAEAKHSSVSGKKPV